MKTLVIGQQEVSKVLTMADCIGVIREALKTLARGEAVLPLRQGLTQPDRKGVLVAMPSFLGQPSALGLKAISVFPGNRDTPFESHQGAVLLFETEHGKLLSIVDAGSVTAIRTAAASGVATDLLARKNATNLAILGSGTQASTHLESMLAVRSRIARIRVWSRNPEHAKRFAKYESNRLGRRVEAVDHAEDAIRGADLICTTTSATTPVLKGSWLSSGAHVNAVGASVRGFRELDTEAVAKSLLFVDRRESAFNEADDFLIPKQEGAVTDNHIRGEIGEVLLGKVQGRTDENEITVFKSLGLSIEDLATAHYVYTQAVAKSMGTWVEFNGERHQL